MTINLPSASSLLISESVSEETLEVEMVFDEGERRDGVTGGVTGGGVVTCIGSS